VTIRIIARSDNADMAANVGGSVLTSFKTFDIEHAELEEFLRAKHSLSHQQVVGAELIDTVNDRPTSHSDTTGEVK